jgi:hypothetical protein
MTSKRLFMCASPLWLTSQSLPGAYPCQGGRNPIDKSVENVEGKGFAVRFYT